MSKSGNARWWVFTNYGLELDYEAIKGMTYVSFGVEHTQEGREHHQGFIHFQNAVSMKTAARRLRSEEDKTNGARVDRMRGTPEQNEIYCEKENPRTTYGVKPAQGQRVDVAEYMNRVREGVSELTLAEDAPNIWAQYGRRGEQLRNMLQEQRTWKTEVKVWWGPPGTGKTFQAIQWLDRQSTAGEGYDEVSVHGDFVVGYKNSPNVLIDDFGPGAMRRDKFLRMMDRYKMTVNVKHSERTWNPKRVAITSNHNPTDWYAESGAVMRRLDAVVHLTIPMEPENARSG